eukprot:UN02813
MFVFVYDLFLSCIAFIPGWLRALDKQRQFNGGHPGGLFIIIWNYICCYIISIPILVMLLHPLKHMVESLDDLKWYKKYVWPKLLKPGKTRLLNRRELLDIEAEIYDQYGKLYDR